MNSSILTKRREIGTSLIDVALIGDYTTNNIKNKFDERLHFLPFGKIIQENVLDDKYQIIIRTHLKLHFSIIFNIDNGILSNPNIDFSYPKMEQLIEWRVLKAKNRKVVSYYQSEMRVGNTQNSIKQIKGEFINKIIDGKFVEFSLIFEVLHNSKIFYLNELNVRDTINGERDVLYKFMKPKLTYNKIFTLERIDFSY